MLEHPTRQRIARTRRVVQIAGYAIAIATGTACLGLAVIVSWWLILEPVGGAR